MIDDDKPQIEKYEAIPLPPDPMELESFLNKDTEESEEELLLLENMNDLSEYLEEIDESDENDIVENNELEILEGDPEELSESLQGEPEPESESEEEASQEYDLEPIKSFIEEYIGFVILSFVKFKEDVEDIHPNVTGKIVAGVKISENKLKIMITSLNGRYYGTIEIAPSLTGSFAEKYSHQTEDTDESIRFRINLLGGHSMEYLDSEDEGSVTYYDNYSDLN